MKAKAERLNSKVTGWKIQVSGKNVGKAKIGSENAAVSETTGNMEALISV